MSNVKGITSVLNDCYYCGAKPGEYHKPDCEVEQCPYCGGHLIDCLELDKSEANQSYLPPPPLDDRIPWTGKWPGKMECEEYGWYAKQNPNGPGWIPCEPDEPGANHDLDRLRAMADWDRMEKRFVRTNLTEAFAAMNDKDIVCNRGYLSKSEAIAMATEVGMLAMEDGEKVNGYAFYTYQAKRKMEEGRNFGIYFGSIKDPKSGNIVLPKVEVGKIVCETLNEHKVKYQWDGNPERPIGVITSSILKIS